MRKLRSAWGIVAGLILLVVLLFVGGSAYGHWRMDQADRVHDAAAESHASAGIGGMSCDTAS